MTPERITIPAARRETIGTSPERVRRAGYIPAVLYGHGVATSSLAVDTKIFTKLLERISSSTLLGLSVDGTDDGTRMLVHEVQHHPLTGDPTHVDFYQVKLTEKIHAKVPLKFEGVSAAVKDLAGTLTKTVDEVDVSSLPQNLPESFLVDISRLATFADKITLRDIVVPEGVEIADNLDEVIAVVTPPRSEEEMKELETAVEENVGEVTTEADEKKAEKEATAAEEAVVPKEKDEKK